MHTALIIDDEQASIDMLKQMLEEHCPIITQVYTATNAQDAGIIILRKQPTIVFTDINMPGVNGIEFINSFAVKNFKLVVVSAYAEYGIAAIKAGVNDYLMKPLMKDELKDCVAKLIALLILETPIKNTNTEVSSEKPFGQKLLVKDDNGHLYLSYDDIIYLQADNNYTKVHCINNKSYTVPKTLKFMAESIQLKHFFRIHKSYFINLNYVVRFENSKSRYIYLEGDAKVRVATDKQNKLKLLLQGKGINE